MADRAAVTALERIFARERVLQAVLRALQAEHPEHESAHVVDEVIYAWELVELASRDLANAVELCPDQPVGWNKSQEI